MRINFYATFRQIVGGKTVDLSVCRRFSRRRNKLGLPGVHFIFTECHFDHVTFILDAFFFPQYNST